MQRVFIAIGAAVIVAAAIVGFLFFGGGEEDVSPDVAESSESATQSPSPPPAPSPAPELSTSSSEAPPADAAAEPQAGEASDPTAPVVQVKPRDPAAQQKTVQQKTAEQQAEATSETMAETMAETTPETAAADAGEAPSFDVVRVEKTGETVIAGRAAPDSEVNVTTQSGESLGRARADRSGAWAIVPEQPLAPGSHEIGIEAEDEKGEKRLSEEVVVVVVPEPKPEPDSISAEQSSAVPSEQKAAAPKAGEEVLAVLTPRQGQGASKVVQQPEEEDGIAEGDLVLDSVDYDEAGRVTVGGRASPGSRLLIYLDNRLVGDTVAGPNRRWSHSPPEPVAEGLHSLRVDQVDGDGNVLARVETPFSREAVRVAEADEEFVIVQPGNSLWRIARRNYGEGIRYTVIYQANKNQIRDPDLIYPGQVFEIPKTN